MFMLVLFPGYLPECFENKVIEIVNESSNAGNDHLMSESRNYEMPRTRLLVGLSPATSYYIGVREIDAGGLSLCFRHISEETKDVNR